MAENGKVAQRLYLIEIFIGSQEVHFADIVGNVLRTSGNAPGLPAGEHGFQEIIALLYLTEVPASVRLWHAPLPGYPAVRVAAGCLVVGMVVDAMVAHSPAEIGRASCRDRVCQYV